MSFLRNSIVFTVSALLCTFQQATAGSDLVLPAGYQIVEVSRDESRYTGGDGLFIHEGNDHLHDPCDYYFDHDDVMTNKNATRRPGLKFTTSRDNGDNNDDANGFLVVNDCQIVSCRKWTSPDEDRDDRFGGETIVYDIVAAEDATVGSPTKWRVQEESDCSCESDNCYLGLFLLVNEYSKDNDCPAEETGTPGSIACTNVEATEDETPIDNAPRPWTFSGLGSGIETVIPKNTLTDGAKAGIAAAVGVFVLAFLYCCCCRKKKKGDADDAEDNDVEQGKQNKKEYVAAVSEKSITAAAATATAAESAPKKRGWLSSSSKKSEELPKEYVAAVSEKSITAATAAATVAAAEPAPKKRGWFTSSKKSEELPTTSPTSGSGEDSVDTEEDSQEETGSTNGKQSSKRTSWFGRKTESFSSTTPLESSSSKSEKVTAPVALVAADPKTESSKATTFTAKKMNSRSKAQDAPTGETNNSEAKKKEVKVPDNTEAVECNCCGM